MLGLLGFEKYIYIYRLDYTTSLVDDAFKNKNKNENNFRGVGWGHASSLCPYYLSRESCLVLYSSNTATAVVVQRKLLPRG